MMPFPQYPRASVRGPSGTAGLGDATLERCQLLVTCQVHDGQRGTREVRQILRAAAELGAAGGAAGSPAVA